MSAESFVAELKARGLFLDSSIKDTEDLTSAITGVYCGFDPTASSLHVGSLLPLIVLGHAIRHNLPTIALVGGATGQVGDPSGKATDRVLLSQDTIEANLEAIKGQISTVLYNARALHIGESPSPICPLVLNNDDWMSTWSFIDFLRTIGSHFRVNQMLAKDSVRQRLEERDQGISYTEFSYMLIQAFDFLHLFSTHKCSLQVGGSDQWGNITEGINLIHKKLSKRAHGITFPLLTDSTGKKMGKTEKGAVWLNLAPVDFFQFWRNVPDSDVIDLLKKLTFLPLDSIQSQEAFLKTGKNKGEVQELLAFEVTSLVHGVPVAQKTLDTIRGMFANRKTDLTTLPEGTKPFIVDVLVAAGFAPSRNEARRLITQGAIKADDVKISDHEFFITTFPVTIKCGKKKIMTIQIQE